MSFKEILTTGHLAVFAGYVLVIIAGILIVADAFLRYLSGKGEDCLFPWKFIAKNLFLCDDVKFQDVDKKARKL